MNKNCKILPIESINKFVLTKLNSERTGERVLDLAQLQNLKLVSADNCNPSFLMDLKDVSIDTSQPIENRMIRFAEQIKNPYLFKVGDIVVKVKYGEDEKVFSDALVNILNAG